MYKKKLYVKWMIFAFKYMLFQEFRKSAQVIIIGKFLQRETYQILKISPNNKMIYIIMIIPRNMNLLFKSKLNPVLFIVLLNPGKCHCSILFRK